MFELYGIFDKSEIIILFLAVIIFILLIVIFVILVLPKVEKEIVTIEKDIMNDDVKEKIEDEFDNNEDNDDMKKKYEELLKEKEIKNNEMIKYSPSEFATLLKYNPILPYSAFTMDIINNAYLDFNEQSNFDDRYFSLNNYDNIYRSYNEPVADDEDTIKMKKLKDKIDKHKNTVDKMMSNEIDSGSPDSKSKTTGTSKTTDNDGLSNLDNNLYN